MRVLMTGATGTIGLAVADALSTRGDGVVALSRDPERAQRVLGDGVEVHAWTEPETAPPPADALVGTDAVVNLLGEPVAQRWSEAAKRRIRDSRVLGAPRTGGRARSSPSRPPVTTGLAAMRRLMRAPQRATTFWRA